METYKSDKVVIDHNIELIYNKLSNPSMFKEQMEKNMDRIPDDAREHLDKVKFEEDGISIDSPMGVVKLSVSESVAPNLVKYVAESSPVPFGLTVNLEAIDDEHTNAIAEINIELPMMIRAMVGGKLSEGAQKMGEVIAKLPYGEM
ncbi:MAG: hypothetical protein J5629_05020 [Muribaculaceae bacterium]|nr:hypothetical protein [Muribaculaceae bacterium]